MSKRFSFLRNFAAAKYYNAAQAGSLDGVGDRSFGALFATTDEVGSLNSIFGNAVYGTSGDGIRLTAAGLLDGSAGTRVQLTGTANATAVSPANASYTQADQTLLANQVIAYRNSINNIVGDGSVDDEGGALSPRIMNMIFAVVTVDISANQRLYVNGRIVAEDADAIQANANPYRIGVDASAAEPATDILLAGCFYTGHVITASEIGQLYMATRDAKDIVGPDGYGAATGIDYIWSVKTGNPDGRDNWTSRGAAATAIDMVKAGATAIDVAGANADILSVEDMDWQTV